jgi:Zn-dependent protease with chaperone function
LLAEQIGVTRCPVLYLVPDRISPLLWSLLASPKVLLPADLVARLSDPELDALIAHELAHLRRRDHWVRYLEVLPASSSGGAR